MVKKPTLFKATRTYSSVEVFFIEAEDEKEARDLLNEDSSLYWANEVDTKEGEFIVTKATTKEKKEYNE